MTIPLNRMSYAERERLAYVEGFTEAAALLATLDDTTIENDKITNDLWDLKEEAQSVSHYVDDLLDELEDPDFKGPEYIDTKGIEKAVDRLDKILGALNE